uniref:Uncharacterized protein n=1 Tax=Tanacetum cinerariifolium TaxID=118510 RepID=A0A699GN70_TANCI|nr:hypothetical protein [Tanacetum cinerariifolium]
MRGFLWCNGKLKRSKAKVAWEDIRLPKSNGKSTSEWFDNWCSWSPLIRYLTPRDITSGGFNTKSCVADLVANGGWLWPQAWLLKASNLGLIQVPTIIDSQPDLVQWRDLNGVLTCFFVGAAWEALRPRGVEVSWYHIVWFSHSIPRHAFHLWLVMRNSLKTQDKLRQQDVGVGTDLNLLQCAFCSHQLDSHAHLFFECSYSSKVWQLVRALAGMENAPPHLHDIMLKLQPIAHIHSEKVFLVTLLWQILLISCGWSAIIVSSRKLEDPRKRLEILSWLSTLVNVMDRNDVRAIKVSINTKFLNSLQLEWSKDAQEDKLTTAMMLLARAITLKFSNPTNNHLRTSSNTRNQAVIHDGRVDIQTKNARYGGNGNRNARRQNKNQKANAGNGQCYNCNARGHYARDCSKPKVHDAIYFKEQMLLAMKDEAGGTLNDEENDFMLDNAYGDETLEELTTTVIMTARIQPADENDETEPQYDAEAVSEVNASHIDLISGLISKGVHEHTNYEKLKTVINTFDDDQIDSNIIFDDPYVENNGQMPQLQTLYAKLGITHNTSTVRTPQQNGVVERRNRTLVEATHKLLIFLKTLEFL